MENAVKTALYNKHVGLGARMVPFAGFAMPVHYSGVNDEHLAVRNAVGVFDVSHMGEFFIRGDGAIELLQYISSNDATKLYDGRVQYAYLPNEQGGIVDDLLIYRMSEKEYMLVINASNIEKDWNWIAGHNCFGAEMENRSEHTALLAVQGPSAAKALQPLTEIPLDALKYYTFIKGRVNGVDDVIVSATGYTGAGGFEIYCDNSHAGMIWDAVMESGAPHGLKPAGLAARDTLRLEMGYCLYGNDIDETTSPLEAGLGWVTKFTKDFVNAQQLKQQKENGTVRKLAAFKMIDRGIPRHGYTIFNSRGEEVGRVTSGTMSPILKQGIGLGYVPVELSTPGTEIKIAIRDKMLKAEITVLPFVNKTS